MHLFRAKKKFVKNCVETAWIMAEIEPYSFEPIKTVWSQRKTLLMRVKMSAEEEIMVCMRVLCELGRAARK